MNKGVTTFVLLGLVGLSTVAVAYEGTCTGIDSTVTYMPDEGNSYSMTASPGTVTSRGGVNTTYSWANCTTTAILKTSGSTSVSQGSISCPADSCSSTNVCLQKTTFTSGNPTGFTSYAISSTGTVTAGGYTWANCTTTAPESDWAALPGSEIVCPASSCSSSSSTVLYYG